MLPCMAGRQIERARRRAEMHGTVWCCSLRECTAKASRLWNGDWLLKRDSLDEASALRSEGRAWTNSFGQFEYSSYVSSTGLTLFLTLRDWHALLKTAVPKKVLISLGCCRSFSPKGDSRLFAIDPRLTSVLLRHTRHSIRCKRMLFDAIWRPSLALPVPP